MTQPPHVPPEGRLLPPELDPRLPRRRPSRSRGRRFARALSWLAVALSVLILLVSVGGYAIFRYYRGQLGTINLGGVQHEVAANADGGGQNYLLVGSDTRNFAGGQAFQGSGADYVTGQRSDTVMLAHIPGGSAKVTLVSFPRDSWVQIPAYTVGGVTHPAHMDKLNAAFSLGGAPLLIRTIEGLSNLHVDHYVEVDFAGFRNMVNALGGVTLCVGTTRHDHDSGDYLTRGVHYVNGDQALAFVRDRKGLPRGDIDRIADQQYFLSQMLKKLLSAGTLANPFKLNAFLSALAHSVTVDSALGFGDMRTLAERLRHLDPAHVSLVTVPITTSAGWRNGQSVVLLNYPAMAAMFTAIRNEGHPAGKAKPSAPPAKLTVPPGQIRVSVYNGTATNGLAHRVANDLAGDGFLIDQVGNAPAPAGGATVVRYGPDRADSARTVAAALGATLQEDPQLPGAVEVIVGSGYHGVVPVHVNGTPAPAAPATSVPTPAPQTAADAACAP